MELKLKGVSEGNKCPAKLHTLIYLWFVFICKQNVNSSYSSLFVSHCLGLFGCVVSWPKYNYTTSVTRKRLGCPVSHLVADWSVTEVLWIEEFFDSRDCLMLENINRKLYFTICKRKYYPALDVTSSITTAKIWNEVWIKTFRSQEHFVHIQSIFMLISHFLANQNEVSPGAGDMESW